MLRGLFVAVAFFDKKAWLFLTGKLFGLAWYLQVRPPPEQVVQSSGATL
jgi:hypothetical protein